MVKQLIIVRTDLGLSKGRLVSQGAHASLAVITNMMNRSISNGGLIQYTLPTTFGSDVDIWLHETFTKVVLKVDSKQQLLDLYKKANELGLHTSFIRESSLIDENGDHTLTCIAVGPAKDEYLLPISEGLKLL